MKSLFKPFHGLWNHCLNKIEKNKMLWYHDKLLLLSQKMCKNVYITMEIAFQHTHHTMFRATFLFYLISSQSFVCLVGFYCVCTQCAAREWNTREKTQSNFK